MTGVPVVVVTGIANAPMATATIALQWDLPNAVVVQQSIDVAEQRLHRVVSDVTGTLDHTVIELQHACVPCAIREDVVPTLHQLTEDGRWDTVIAHLPVGAEASQVCRVSAHEGRAGVRIANVVAALEGETLIEDLLGDDLLCERGLYSSDEDERGVGEAGTAIIEYADHIALSGTALDKGAALVSALARPGVPVVGDVSGLDARALLATCAAIRPPSHGSPRCVAHRSTRPPATTSGPWTCTRHCHCTPNGCWKPSSQSVEARDAPAGASGSPAAPAKSAAGKEPEVNSAWVRSDLGVCPNRSPGSP